MSGPLPMAAEFQAVFAPNGEAVYVGNDNLFYRVPHFSPYRVTVTAAELVARKQLPTLR